MKFLSALQLVAFFLLGALEAHSQIKPPFTNNGLRKDLCQVVSDFTTNFSTLKGAVIAENPQTIEYASLLNFSGCEQNTITKYISTKSIYSWKAVMLSSEDFAEACKKYDWLYHQLKVMTLQVGDYTFTLNGTYETPDESKSFCTSTFTLLPADAEMPRLKIEVAMQFEFPEWKAIIQIFEKEREDDERGNIRDDAPRR